MAIAAQVLFALIALEHVWFLVLEMFLWTTPRGLKTFRMTQEQADATARLAKNQGLYNGFLAAGLVFGLLHGWPAGFEIDVFFAACVLVAGLFGAVTVSKRILYVQALPALLAIAIAFTARP
jgi:putative membrane protein